MTGRTAVVPILTQEARIKRALRTHLRALDFRRTQDGALIQPDQSKQALRTLHRAQLEDRLRAEREFIRESWAPLQSYFADGFDIEPHRISPRLELIDAGTWQSDLFRLASLTWSVPVSRGYGRRLRFLVWDSSNQKLMGLMALGDPVFNLRVRDEHVGWSASDRQARLVNVLDAYVLGALPPYSNLLGGKLIASLVATVDIRDAFRKRYGDAKGIISREAKRPSLVMVTTSSSLGRSSVYNRLRLGEYRLFHSVGFTSGWGHFHIPDRLFQQMRAYLQSLGHRYAKNHQFGDGPNWRMRAVRECLTLLGMNPDLLKHGVERNRADAVAQDDHAQPCVPDGSRRVFVSCRTSASYPTESRSRRHCL